MLERRRLRKLWQKEQRVKGQANAVKVDLKDISADLLDNSPSAEISSSNALQTTAEHVPSPFKPVQTCSAEEDNNTEAQSGFNCEHSDLGTFPNAEPQTVRGNGLCPRWQMPKSQSFGRNGFYSTQNPQVRTRKPKMENKGKSMKSMLLTEDVAKTDQHKTSEMIGFISVSLGCCTAQRQDDDLIEAQEQSSTEHAISKPTKIDSVHGGSQFTVKLRRPVSQHEASGPMPVQNCKVDIITGGKDSGRMVPSETCLSSRASGDNVADSHPPVAKSAPAEGLLFSSNSAKAFLAQSMVIILSFSPSLLCL
ncbi:hypothetical protein RHGRI_013262 [Rhododendron griersonianum]|uniref:Uncharacterized protein n=1 Tax=Rhododendron griersonianum TaxID=479676 RepID=A0AAV6K5C1_9ERIC|nr:hypothetical protein RHGRI_013262 [Rhododendron griersonianum]